MLKTACSRISGHESRILFSLIQLVSIISTSHFGSKPSKSLHAGIMSWRMSIMRVLRISSLRSVGLVVSFSALILLDSLPVAGQKATGSRMQAEDPADFSLAPSEMQPLLERYLADHSTLARSLSSDISPAYRSRMKDFYSQWQGTLSKVNFEKIGLAGQVDYILLKNTIEHESQQLEMRSKTLAEMGALIPFAKTIIDLDEALIRMEWVDPASAADQLNAMNKQIESVKQAVEAGLKPQAPQTESIIPKKTVANRAAATVDLLRNRLQTWFTFYNGYDPIFTWWVEAPYTTVDKSLQNYASFLRERIVGLKPEPAQSGSRPNVVTSVDGQGASVAIEPGSAVDIVGDPVGYDGLMVELAHEMIPYTPEDLIAIANREYAWCENEMKKASHELGYGDDWLKALEHVKTLHVEPGKQPELIRSLVLDALKFVDDRDLITVPPLARETWKMRMMSPQEQLISPFFRGGEILSVSYPTNTMTHEQKMMSMRGNNKHFVHAVVLHEVFPGHSLQSFMLGRYRAYRTPFGTVFSIEGWSLYWELLMYDLGYQKTPEDRMGALFFRMHRCARIIFSLSFHLGKMTPQECIDFLVNKVGFERENAIAEVRRSFTVSRPLYQAAYMLGGLQIYALHKELVDSGKMTNRAFHDAFLRENSIPVELIRATLTKQKLNRDFASSWKFYGPAPKM